MFYLMSDRGWESLVVSCSFFFMYVSSPKKPGLCIHSFLYKNKFIRTKPLVLKKKLRTNTEKNKDYCPAEHKNKVSRLAISKIIKTEHQNRAWLSFILYCM